MAALRRIVMAKAGRDHPQARAADGALAYEPGQALPGGFVIDEIIGEGASSLVLKAHKPAIHPPIYKAIKVVNTRCVERGSERAADVQKEYYGEAKVSFEIGSDPYAISVEDILVMPDGSRALVCPFVRGHTLSALRRDHIRRGWLFPFELSAFILHRILSVLIHAKERGIPHRDLCGSNIMVQRTGVPVVLDWGAAGETDEGLIVGKPEYMAPEVVRHPEAVTGDSLFKADIFSLGAVIREMLVGYNSLDYPRSAGEPYDVERALSYREALHTDGLASVQDICPDTPGRLSNIIYTCMKDDPDKRLDVESLYDYVGSEYLYTPQVGFGPTAETLKDYLEYFYHPRDPEEPLPESRQGRSLERVIASTVRRKAEQPEYRGYLLKYVVSREQIPLTFGSVGRTFARAFGEDRADAARRALLLRAIAARYAVDRGRSSPESEAAFHAECRQAEAMDGQPLEGRLRDEWARQTGKTGGDAEAALQVATFRQIVGGQT
jgi:serine/threonine protein kinase